MNRILQVDNKFFVLLTPNYVSITPNNTPYELSYVSNPNLNPDYTSNPSMELLLGNFTDENIRNFSVLPFNTLNDAMTLAFRYSPIDWNKLVSIHEDSFHFISNHIKNIIDHGNHIVYFEPHFMSPLEIKETMFNRVLNMGKRYSLYYNMSDIICFNIVSPTTGNLANLVNVLKNSPKLNIKKIVETPTHLKLIGYTPVGTVYEIRIWADLLYQWAKRIYVYKLEPELYLNDLNTLIEKQKLIDNNL